MKKFVITIGIALVILCGFAAMNGCTTNDEAEKVYTDHEIVRAYVVNELDYDEFDIELIESDKEGYIEYAIYVDGDISLYGSLLRAYGEGICRGNG